MGAFRRGGTVLEGEGVPRGREDFDDIMGKDDDADENQGGWQQMKGANAVED